ncbi:MAG: hypothetical protein RR192_03125 [Peptostreptococcaceae bacterium]
MNPIEIMEQLYKGLADLEKGNIRLNNLSVEKNEAERIYRIELAKKILMLRIDKCPVSIIHDLARGDERIAELRFKRDVAKSNYYTCKSAIDNLKSKIEVNRSLLTWQRFELTNS